MKKTITIFILVFGFTFPFSSLNAQTYFSDNFESGLSKWIVGGNSWDTLSTTYTTSNHCVTDSRIGNYTYNSDPIITKAQSINLSNTTFPVLTFFHRYSLAIGNCCCFTDYDNISLEISTNGGFNWSQLKSWNGSNRAWTHEQIDLRDYKFTLVKFRFKLSSHNHCSYVEDGWYIDDVKVQEFISSNPTFTFPFCDSFENGTKNWFKGGFNWDTSSINPSSGLFCVADSKTGSYVYNSDPTITMSGVLNLSNTISPVLTFFHRYSLAVGNCCCFTDYDYINLEISTNGGFNWTQLQSWQGSNLSWTFEQFDLSNYRTDKVKIRYHLTSHNHCGYSADGAYLDDVCIYDLSPNYINLNLKALIEGFYNPETDEMAIQDTLTVFLRNATSLYTFRDTAKCVFSPFTFAGQLFFKKPPTGNYFLVVKHRNSIETWSKPVYLVRGDGSVNYYDFTTDSSKAFGNNLIKKGSKWCIYSGDVNQEGFVDASDMAIIDNDLGEVGYVRSDVNGDFFVDGSDLLIADNNGYRFVSIIRP